MSSGLSSNIILNKMELYKIKFIYNIDNPSILSSEEILCKSYRAALTRLKNEIERVSVLDDAIKQYPHYFYESNEEESDGTYIIKKVKDNIEYEKRLKEIYEKSDIPHKWTWKIYKDKFTLYEDSDDEK